MIQMFQYQGSKRALAKAITKFFPTQYNRLVEPFAGSAAISLHIAQQNLQKKFWLNDINHVLMDLVSLIIDNPEYITEKYKNIWNACPDDTIYYFNHIRDEFNINPKPEYLLYLISRCIKGSIRYNNIGGFNQSADKRRLGTHPTNMARNLYSVAKIMYGRCEISKTDYKVVLKNVQKGDLIYLDPPYRGVSQEKKKIYHSAINHEEFIEQLDILNSKNIQYIVSYDGSSGDKLYGEDLPKYLNLKKYSLNAGLSSQSTLLGRHSLTLESLYVSETISENVRYIQESEQNNIQMGLL